MNTKHEYVFFLLRLVDEMYSINHNLNITGCGAVKGNFFGV